MSEYQINERRNWKAEVFPYDYYIPDDTKECLYCLTEKQAEILRGIIMPLGWRTRWWTNESEPIDRDKIEQFRDDLIERLMMSCCGDETPIMYRYNGGVLQKSTDGGLTWVDSPENDYRNNSTTWPNPNDLGIDVSKCAGADAVVATFRDQMNEQIADDMAATAIVGVIVGVLLFILSAGTTAAITAQIVALAAAIFGAGVATWKALFTSDVWDAFRCMVLKAMTTDLSIDSVGITGLMTAIDGGFAGIIAQTLKGYVNASGAVGLTNMMRSGSGDAGATCDGCLGCSDNWHVALDDEQYGTIIDRGEGFVLVRAGFDIAQNRYTIIIDTGEDNTVCCNWHSVVATVGDTPLAIYIANCGSDSVVSSGLTRDIDVHTLYWFTDATTPFTFRFNFN